MSVLAASGMSAFQPCHERSRGSVQLLFCGVLLAHIAGCALVGPGDDFFFDLALQTDESEYVADTTETIQLSIVNRKGSQPVYFLCTMGISLEELNGGLVTKEWFVYGGQECLYPGSIPALGEVHAVDIPFSRIREAIGISAEITHDAEARLDRSMDYRLVVYLYTDLSEDQLIPLSERVSNQFKIAASPPPI